MNQRIRLCAVVPVYNHHLHLAEVVATLRDLELPVVLVDDGSTEPCAGLLRELEAKNDQVHLAVHAQNQGKGAAIKTGLRLAADLGFSHALQVDADGQHNLKDIPRFAALSREHPGALVAGYPVYDESIPKYRYYGRYASHVWVWINCLSREIRDSMCGFRVYPVDASLALIGQGYIGDRMEFDGEFIVRWYWSGQPLVQQQTWVTYPEDGVSHFRLWRDNLRISLMHTRLFFGMLLRAPKLLTRRTSGY